MALRPFKIWRIRNCLNPQNTKKTTKFKTKKFCWINHYYYNFSRIRIRELFYFTKYLPENLVNTIEDDKERLSTSFEWKFCEKFYSYLQSEISPKKLFIYYGQKILVIYILVLLLQFMLQENTVKVVSRYAVGSKNKWKRKQSRVQRNLKDLASCPELFLQSFRKRG